jgi:hypothetical protein
MEPNFRRGSFIRTVAVLIFVALASTALFANETPQGLVKEMVHNELTANQHQNYWMYRDSDTQSGKTTVSRVVETPDCWFRWVLSINGEPLAPAQVKKQQARMTALVNSESAREKNRADILQDGKKAETLVKMLPDIFVYTEDGEQDGNIRLQFRPNPQFDPPTDAAKVFHHMQGTLLINAREKRLAGISGTLMQNVDFGWGILGRLYKGGTFKVRQTQLAPEDWEVTTLDVHIHGRALFFHTISEDQTEVKTGFEPVPQGVTLTQAAALAEHGTENASAAAK